jgi:putative DNA primase/helicase
VSAARDEGRFTERPTAKQIAYALGGTKREGNDWRCLCPGHDDHDPSLSITEKDGRVLFICRAGCSQNAVLDALHARGLWPQSGTRGTRNSGSRREVATYNYHDANGTLRYQVIRYAPKGFSQRRSNGAANSWIPNMDGVERLPYRLPELLADPDATVFIAEGEKDCDNLVRHGLVATCNSSGAGNWQKEISHWFAGRDIVILPDNDDAGRSHAQDVANKLTGIAGSVRILELPGLPLKGDISDWLKAGGSTNELKRLAAAVPIFTGRAINGHDSNAQSHCIPFKTGRDFTLQKIEWLWRGWLARRKFHLLAGQKGDGKSTITFDLMACVSVGGKWPDGSQAPLGDVLIWSGEDCIEDTILPRFVAAGGDLGRIYPVKDIIVEGKTRPFDPSTDIPKLIEMAEKIPNLLLAVIDPVVLALPAKSDSHKNAETRRGLQPLIDFVERRGVALIGITHFTKGTADRDPIERVTGSLAFGALPRCVWGTSTGEDGFQRRLVRIASNIGPTGGGIEYTLHEEPLIDYGDLSAQRISWGAKLIGSPIELLTAEKQSAKAAATAFLREFLANGSKPQPEIKDAAEAHGHTWATIRRAQQTLRIKPKQADDGWHWELPEQKSTWSPD